VAIISKAVALAVWMGGEGGGGDVQPIGGEGIDGVGVKVDAPGSEPLETGAAAIVAIAGVWLPVMTGEVQAATDKIRIKANINSLKL
jgi:hypothetical protein